MRIVTITSSIFHHIQSTFITITHTPITHPHIDNTIHSITQNTTTTSIQVCINEMTTSVNEGKKSLQKDAMTTDASKCQLCNGMNVSLRLGIVVMCSEVVMRS